VDEPSRDRQPGASPPPEPPPPEPPPADPWPGPAEAPDAPDWPGPAEAPDAPDAPDAPEPALPPSRTARARAQAEHLRIRAQETVKTLESKRPANRWIDAGFATFERDVTSGGGVLAAALAFRVFIFMVPFVFVVVTAFPFAADASNTDPKQLADKFGMAGLVATAINSSQDMSFWSRLSLLVAGLFALVLASRSLVRVLRITHGLAWHTRVPKLRRPTLAALVLIGSITGIVLFGAWTSKLQGRVGVIGLVPMLLGGVVLVAVWAFVQHHLPHADVPWTKLIPGAVLVALGVEGLQLVTVVWFTRYIESKSETYGAIGAALAILLWAYFLGRIIVTGAMLNAALYEQEHPAGAADAGPAPPGGDADPAPPDADPTGT
jgi:uncharacterized BrkB/YihY/UPF0761 family membrane protein